MCVWKWVWALVDLWTLVTHPEYDSSGVTYFYCVYVYVREGVCVIRSMTHRESRPIFNVSRFGSSGSSIPDLGFSYIGLPRVIRLNA